jgi:hypothetical protein
MYRFFHRMHNWRSDAEASAIDIGIGRYSNNATRQLIAFRRRRGRDITCRNLRFLATVYAGVHTAEGEDDHNDDGKHGRKMLLHLEAFRFTHAKPNPRTYAQMSAK